MIHYHGGPITPLTVALSVWKRRHAFVSPWLAYHADVIVPTLEDALTAIA